MKKLLPILMISNMALGFVPRSFSTQYKQIVKNQLTGTPKESTGRFDYEYPGKLRLEQKGSDALVYVTNEKTTWIRRDAFMPGDPAEIIIHKGSDKGLSNFFDLLKNGLKSNKNYKVKDGDNYSVLVFSETSVKSTGVVETKLTFKKGKKEFSNITSIDINYADGKVVKLELSNVKNESFQAKHFILNVPKNANVSYQ
ncbi:LolA family protein [Halobacteriovorax sp. RT-2-4]|uniref:LolA family protein n=1 Tax=unclassified Halobacteriovorax TaxID=2639665 RepID=UPI00399982F2